MKIFFFVVIPLLLGCSPQSASVRVIDISCDNSMKFSVTTIEAKPVESITVKLSNKGDAPKASMGHNWVLLAKETDLEKFVQDGEPHREMDFIAPKDSAYVVAKTKMLGPGESDSVTFTAPNDPGLYNYVCTFPGHYDLGMRGTLKVTR
jgi:azurin